LLAGNSLYTSPEFIHDVHERNEYRMRIDTWLKGIIAKRSIYWADCTVAPTHAFADDLEKWSGHPIATIHHGFDCERFLAGGRQLRGELQERLEKAKGSLRLLFVSHYNYYRNFETLFQAIPLLRSWLGNRKVKLFLTCTLDAKSHSGAYDVRPAAALVKKLGIGEQLVELGAIPYDSLNEVYRACDIYVTPAYTETFAHPLVEAMASGLPVVASDLAVHREVCGEAALYFSRFLAAELAAQVMRIVESPQSAAEMKFRGEARSRDFSWSRHLDELVELAEKLTYNRNGRRQDK
jgi:glycosyltransferase involved in cell wall biosynthesis